MKLINKIRQKNRVIVNLPKKDIYFTITKEPSCYHVEGYRDDQPINFHFTSESDLWEFASSIS